MTATLIGRIQGQTVIFDKPIPEEYDGVCVSVYMQKQPEMSAEERIAAIATLRGKGGSIFPKNVTEYIRSIRDDDR